MTLAPTLAALSPPESLVLTLAALLPPDHVPLPWLRAVAAATFPDLGQDAPPGYDDPWLSLVNHLISLRLLQVVDLAADGRTPRLCRVHRLVQEVVKKTQPDDQATRERALLDHIRDRALVPLGRLGPARAPLGARPPDSLRRPLAGTRRRRRPLACLLRGRPVAAARQLRGRRAPQPPRRRADASRQPQLRSAPQQPGGLLQATNRLAEAEPLFRRALAIDESSYGPDHPTVANDLNNLAEMLQATNRLAEAEPLLRRALAICEKSLGHDHPQVATALNNLAELLRATNRLAEAEPLLRRRWRSARRRSAPTTLRRHRPQQPGAVA